MVASRCLADARITGRWDDLGAMKNRQGDSPPRGNRGLRRCRRAVRSMHELRSFVVRSLCPDGLSVRLYATSFKKREAGVHASSHQSLPVENDDDSGTFARAKGCPVRISIWSRELLFLLIFLGGAGFLVVADRDSRQDEGIERPSCGGTIRSWSR